MLKGTLEWTVKSNKRAWISEGQKEGGAGQAHQR